MSTEELAYLEWFTCESSTKLPGAFGSVFWSSIVLQTCLYEPAILHALLALSATHKGGRLRCRSITTNEAEQFALRQYSKAITHLQPHFLSRSKASMRVALISCLIFVSLEFLRSHYKAGVTHLESGLNLLKDMQHQTAVMQHSILVLRPSDDLVDICVFEDFAKLDIQAQLLGQRPRHLKLLLHTRDPEFLPYTFLSVNEARLTLDKLLHGILLFYKQRCSQWTSSDISYTTKSITTQRRMQVALTSWLETYQRSTFTCTASIPQMEAFARELLQNYHTMAEIIADTCLWPDLETRFDAYTEQFACIINRSDKILGLYSSLSLNGLDKAFSADTTAITDMGWIPPLFFVAIKCRSHHLRTRAIELIKSAKRKEGIWDSTVAAFVAEEVMRIEERGFYDVTDPTISSGSDLAGDLDVLTSPLPEAQRLSDVQIILPDDASDMVRFVCRQTQDDGLWKDVTRAYNADLQRWMEVSTLDAVSN